jgi:cytochrome c biogenesis protein ResB
VLTPLPHEAQHESNVAGAYVTVVEKSGGARTEAIVWGQTREPLTVMVDGRTFGIELRRERYLMPFTVSMEDFVKEDHPRMDMPKAFSSDVTVFEGASSRPAKIQMNEPLRSAGLVLYQSSWGPSNARPGERLFSTLAVVRNPADQYPLYACIVIALGMTLHFTRKLAKHIRSEAKRS